MSAFQQPKFKGGIANFMKSYDDMHKWYCAQEATKTKEICKAKPKAGSSHSLINPLHKDHKEWRTLVAAYCAQPDSKTNVVCKFKPASPPKPLPKPTVGPVG